MHLVLLAASFAVTWFLPETVHGARPLRTARPRRPSLPPEVRGVFVPAAIAAFAGFSLLGLFTSVTPAFLGQSLGIHNHAVVGLIVFAAFFASTLGQLLVPRLGTARAIPLGCLVLIAGLALLAASLAWTVLAPLVLSALVGGAGQGMACAGRSGRSPARPPPNTGAAPSPRCSWSPTSASPCPSSGSACSPNRSASPTRAWSSPPAWPSSPRRPAPTCSAAPAPTRPDVAKPPGAPPGTGFVPSGAGA